MQNDIKISVLFLFLLGNFYSDVLAMDVPEKRETTTETFICSICRGSFDNNEKPMYLCIDARHTTHDECIKRWQLRSSTCPECRRQLPLTMSQRLQRMFPCDEETPPNCEALKILGGYGIAVLCVGLSTYLYQNEQKP